MDQPYVGPHLGPLQPNPPPAEPDSWDAFPVVPKAEAKADDWSQFPEASPGIIGTAKDVGKSLAAGLGKGVAGLAGLPGVAAEYGARGIDAASRAVGDAIGVDVPKREARDVTYGPDAAQKAIESVTGDFHQPETTAGKYAETIGEFAPSAVMGPGGVVRNVVMQGVLPAVASEAAGQAAKGTSFETPARIAAGLVTGGAAAALSRPGTASQIVRRQLPEGITEQHVNDAERLVQEANSRGINLSYPEALSQAAGRPVLTETQRMVESSPETRSRMQEFFGDRPQQFDQAALDAFQPITPGTATPSSIGRGASEAAEGHLTDVRQAINNAAEPHYLASEAVTLTPAEMAQVRQIPGFDEAARAVRNGPNAWRVQHLPDESVGFLNAVKKHFDTSAENAGSKFNPMRSHETQATHEMQASAVKQIGEYLSPDYRTALEIGRRGRERFLQPLMDGPLGKIAGKPDTKKAISVLFPSNPLPNSHNEVADAVGVLARRNPWAATQLVRAYAEQTFNEATRSLQSGANQFGPAGFAKAIVGNAQQRENLRAAIESLPNGQQLWDGFDRFLEIAEATRYRQTIGSKTAFNDAERKALSASNLGREAVKTGASPGKWWTLVSDKVDKWSLGRNLDELARIFTDPQSAALLRRIVAMPRGSNEAGVAAARLISQAAQSARKPTEPRRP
jgi:hypothetical protein